MNNPKGRVVRNPDPHPPKARRLSQRIPQPGTGTSLAERVATDGREPDRIGDYELLTEGEVARLIRMSVYKLQRDRCNGKGIPYLRLGRSIRYRRSDVVAFIDRCTPRIT